jgi:uncharacterized protein (DUF1015 family)
VSLTNIYFTKEEMVMDLTKVNGCYSKELRESCYAIKLMLKEPKVSVAEMIRVVKALIEPAYIVADAKKRFIHKLEKCETKEAVDELCHDAVMHGMWYRPKRRVVA